MKIIIRPVMDPQREVDLTRQLVSAIAAELWQLYGGNEQLNWLEAERHLEEIVSQARTEAEDTSLVLVNGGVEPDRTPGRECSGKRRIKSDQRGRRNVRTRSAACATA